MVIIHPAVSYFGSPHPWIVLAHFGAEARREFFREYKKSFTHLPGTIINASGNELDEGEGLSQHEYRTRVEWRLIAMDAADYILLHTSGHIESTAEMAIYAKTGKLYLIRNADMESEREHVYYNYICDLFRLPQLDSPVRLLQVMNDAESHAEEKRPLF